MCMKCQGKTTREWCKKKEVTGNLQGEDSKNDWFTCTSPFLNYAYGMSLDQQTKINNWGRVQELAACEKVKVNDRGQDEVMYENKIGV